MDNRDIISKLRLMKLPVMAELFEEQLKITSYAEKSFEERFGQLIDAEYESRVNHTISRLIHHAHFADSTACIEDINYYPDRKLDKGQIQSLATNEYIKRGLSIIMIGASGSGKTWLGCAFGVNACRDRYTVQYIRMPELFSRFEEARITGNYRAYIKKLSKIDLLIIDEFLLTRLRESEINDLLEIMELRCNKKSTILCSQYTFEGWHSRLGGSVIADSILDRISNSSYIITLQGKSLREVYSKLNPKS